MAGLCQDYGRGITGMQKRMLYVLASCNAASLLIVAVSARDSFDGRRWKESFESAVLPDV